MVSVTRITSEKVADKEKLRRLSEAKLKETYPEWWTLAEYLSENLWTTAIGLVVTFLGLLFELLYNLKLLHGLTVPL